MTSATHSRPPRQPRRGTGALHGEDSVACPRRVEGCPRQSALLTISQVQKIFRSFKYFFQNLQYKKLFRPLENSPVVTVLICNIHNQCRGSSSEYLLDRFMA